VHSDLGLGTASVARIWSGPRAPATGSGWEAGLVALPVRGETISGDGAALVTTGSRSVIVMSDGLGHGPLAADASIAALAVLRERSDLGPKDLIDAIHLALRPTRGAAVAVVEVDWASRRVCFCGVGNVAATLYRTGVKDQHLMSHNGIVGHIVSRTQEFKYDLPQGSMLVMNTDGLKSSRSANSPPVLFQRDVSVIAGILFRDNARERDDATVVVLRERNGHTAPDDPDRQRGPLSHGGRPH
jgi:hypothetical protein